MDRPRAGDRGPRPVPPVSRAAARLGVVKEIDPQRAGDRLSFAGFGLTRLRRSVGDEVEDQERRGSAEARRADPERRAINRPSAAKTSARHAATASRAARHALAHRGEARARRCWWCWSRSRAASGLPAAATSRGSAEGGGRAGRRFTGEIPLICAPPYPDYRESFSLPFIAPASLGLSLSQHIELPRKSF